MTQDEIQRLLGGYATDALTPDQRRALFQAALEDQDLFNTLANEDALKELLDDPVTRAQLRTAIAPRRRQFHLRRWLLGVAIPAVVAVALVVMMNRAGAPRLVATNQAANEAPRMNVNPPAATPPVAAPPVAQPERVVQAKQPRPKKKAKTAAPAVPNALPPPAPESVAGLARPRAIAPTLATLRAPGGAPIPPAIVRQLDQGFRSGAPLYQGPLVQYALLRSGPNGQAIQLRVTTAFAGYLALYEVDAAGNSARVYPASEVAVRIAPSLPVQIPPQPIEIPEAGAKLRLVVVEAPMPVVGGFVPGTQGAIGATSAPGAADVQAPPLVVEIPLVR